MSYETRRDVLTKLAALFGTASAAGLPFREDDGEVLTGVVDRIVNDLAVVLLEDADGDLIDQTHVSIDELPKPATEEGAVLEIVLDGGDVDRVRFDKPETDRRREETEDRFDELAK